MAATGDKSPYRAAVQKLTKQEIDRRIEQLAGQLAAGSSSSRNPRWIAPAELVRRLRPFVVHN